MIWIDRLIMKPKLYILPFNEIESPVIRSEFKIMYASISEVEETRHNYVLN